ncbi:hypothetical protein GCM10029964_088220 [Kibdelosporangium lantanae]
MRTAPTKSARFNTGVAADGRVVTQGGLLALLAGEGQEIAHPVAGMINGQLATVRDWENFGFDILADVGGRCLERAGASALNIVLRASEGAHPLKPSVGRYWDEPRTRSAATSSRPPARS